MNLDIHVTNWLKLTDIQLKIIMLFGQMYFKVLNSPIVSVVGMFLVDGNILIFHQK